MTDKQIIIDGFNLEYIKKLLYNGQRSAITTNIFEAIIEELERKEQECEQLRGEIWVVEENLKDYIEHYNRQCEQLDQLKAENEELKDLNTRLDNQRETYWKGYQKLKQTLAEIKKIAEFYNHSNMDNICYQDGIYDILQKIREVEDGTC